MKLTVSNQSIEFSEKSLIVEKSNGLYECEFTFSDDWDGYSKTAIFQNGSLSYSVAISEGKATIPYETLVEGLLQIGVCGINGTIQKPTVWSEPVRVLDGAYTGLTPSPVTPTQYEQIMAIIGDMEDLDTTAKDTLVNAINEIVGVMCTDTELATAVSELHTWVEAKGYATETSVDTKDATTLASAKTYADTKKTEAISTSESYTDDKLTDYRTASAQDVIDATKVDKVEGKGLSTNDYTTAEKTKLSGIEEGAEVNPSEYLVNASVSNNKLTITDESGNVVEFEGGGDVSSVNGKTGAVTLYGTDINMSSDASLPTVTEQISSNKTNIDELTTEVARKQDLISSPTANNIVLANASGQVIDSGYSIDDVAKTNPKTWKDVQDVVRLGLGELKYPVGSTFTVNITGLGDTVWTVMHHIHNGDSGSIHLKNGLQHGMILQARDVLYYGLFPYDEKEAFYSNEEAMSVGTYNFLLGQHTWVSGDVGKYFQFTTNVTIPADAQFVFQQAYNATLEGASVKIYASGSPTTVLDTVTLTEGQGGTYLGELRNTFSGNFNSCQRGFFGNNRWKESFERQFLNSDLSGNFFTAQNKWDRIHSYQSNSGFMYRLPTEFKNVIGEVNLDTVLNTVCDGGGIETTSDKIFLPSRTEVYGGQENTSDNGVAWQQYINAIGTSSPTTSATDGRVKVSIGTSTARYWWWRSPLVSNAYCVRRSSTTGALDSGNASSLSFGVSPACVIC